MLWVDKYRPTSLDKLDHHTDVTERLKNLAEAGEIPHLLFYGPSGAGKKTRIMALMKAIFGNGVEKLRLEHKTFKASNASETKIEITTVASNYHIEMNPSDVGIRDRYVVQEVIKEIAQYQPLDTSSTAKSFKVVLLMEVDRLSKQAQHALRRTMEKYSGACRLILCCVSSSKVIEPVRSRCLSIRVGAPEDYEVKDILHKVCKKEGLQLPSGLATRIVLQSERNLRRALLMLEACKVQRYPFAEDQEIQLPDWELHISAICKKILMEQSPTGLLDVRSKLYDLLTNCIPADVILKTIVRDLCSRMDEDFQLELIKWAAYYEHRIQMGSKEIYHLEAFVAKIMSCYKRFVIDTYL